VPVCKVLHAVQKQYSKAFTSIAAVHDDPSAAAGRFVQYSISPEALRDRMKQVGKRCKIAHPAAYGCRLAAGRLPQQLLLPNFKQSRDTEHTCVDCI